MVYASFGKRVDGMGRDGLPIQIELPAHYLDEEVRCGYTVTSSMKKIWAVELDLLAKFDEVCSKHAIQYVALWGTALGAVRHNGFIPWDDDIDVGMDRENYDKLCAIAPKEFKEPYFFQNALTDRAYFSPMARLRNSLTTAAIRGFDTLDYNNGIYIDIDILDGLAQSKVQWHWQNILKHIALIPLQSYYGKAWATKGWVHRICYGLCPFWHLVRYESWCRLYQRIRCMYSKSSDKLGISYSFLVDEWGRWIKKEDLKLIGRRQFEFLTIPIAGNINEFLIRCYGAYREFPPEKDRGVWHSNQVRFDVYNSYRELLRKA